MIYFYMGLSLYVYLCDGHLPKVAELLMDLHKNVRKNIVRIFLKPIKSIYRGITQFFQKKKPKLM